MKLEKTPKGYCVLHVDEMLDLTSEREQNELAEMINASGASRKSFNTWLFPSHKSAEEFVFMYNLKYGKQ
jgi:hypothetical protein